MRQPCLQCFRKHIGNAAVLAEEVDDGYPYAHLVVGHLDQAAQEIRGYSRLLADVVRAHRIKWQQDHSHPVPYEAFDALLDILEDMDPDSLEKDFPELPEACYAGLDELAGGNGWNLMRGDQR